MKKINLLPLFFIIIMIMGSCWPEKKLTGSGYVIAPLSDTTKIKGGTVVYSLPMTVFTFKVEMERTIELPGPYAKYGRNSLVLRGL